MSTQDVAIFSEDKKGGYVQLPQEPFVFEVGASCQTWSRSNPGHKQMGNLEENLEQHDHFNAADEITYSDGTVTWVEYGPEHYQEDIDETCAAGDLGAYKEAYEDHVEDHEGIFLKIISVEIY